MGSENDCDLPPHIEETVRSLAQLHIEHHRNVTPFQRRIGSLTAFLIQPWLVGLLTAGVVVWIGLNVLAPKFGYAPLDPPPFAWLEIAVSLGSLYLMILIVATQRHDDRLAELREQLTLELALLSEQKTAKMIQLLEELRRDMPSVEDRIDDQANAMSRPADPERVINAIRETHIVTMDEAISGAALDQGE